MKYGDIDDLLVNIDENMTAKDPVQEPEKPTEPPAALPEKKEPKMTGRHSLPEDVPYLNDIDSDLPADGNSENPEIPEEVQSPEPDNTGETEPSGKKDLNSDFNSNGQITEKKIEPYVFVIRGTRTWNSREPYTIPIDRDKLNADYNDLQKTFFFIKEHANEPSTQGDMKRAMFKYIRAPETVIIEEFSEFINSKLLALTSELGNDFGFQQDKHDLFIYHLGIMTIYKIIISEFQETKTAFCFKLLSGNSVVKYIPLEFIKNVTLKWHDDNINGSDLQYDSIIDYNELKRVIYKYYVSEYEKYNKKLDDVLSKSNSNLNKFEREQILKNKGNVWFGRNNIYIYNRFLERTIFKSAK